MLIVHIRRALPANAHHRVQRGIDRSVTVRHGRLVIVPLPVRALQAIALLVIARLGIAHPVLQVIVPLATDHHVLPVTDHLVVLQGAHHVAARWAAQVVRVVRAVVDSTVGPSAVVSVAQSPAAVAETQDNAAIAPTVKVPFVVQMRPRAMARDVAKALKAANQAR